MKSIGVICGGVLAASLWAASPALAQNRIEQQLLLDMRELQEQERQLLLALNSLSDQLKAVSGKVDAEANSRVKGVADLQTLINNANSNISALQENVRDNKVQVQKLSQEFDAVKKGLDMLTVMVTQALAQMPSAPPGGEPNTSAGAGGAPPPPPTAGVPASCPDYYNQAFGDYAVAQYDSAIQGLQEFLKRCATAPDAAQAQRLIGESYFMMGKNAEAVAAFDQVTKKYKSDPSDAVPDSYYKQGVAYEQLKQREKAIENYQLVRKDYPDSTAALQATQALKRLNAPLK